MAGKPTAGERMEAIIHDEKFQGVPCCLLGFKSIRIGNLPTQLPDNSLDDVIRPRHPRVIQMRPKIRKLSLQEAHHCPQPPALKRSATGSIVLKGMVPLRLVFHIQQLASRLQKGPGLVFGNLQLIPYVVAQKALHMSHTELKRDRGVQELAGLHKAQISINNQALERVAQGPLDTPQGGHPGLRIFTGMEAGIRNIVSAHISGEEESVFDPFHKDTLPIRQKISRPLRLEFVSYLLKALALLSQLLDPPPGGMGINVQLSAHSSIGCFFRKIQIGCSHLHLQAILRLFQKRFSTGPTLPPLKMNPPFSPFLPIRSIFPEPGRSTLRTAFFSSMISSHLNLS